MTNHRKIAYLLFACLFTATAGVMGQATLNVPAAYPTVQTAIDQATNGDTVLVAPGIYFENIDFIGKAITVRSSDGPAVTTLHGLRRGTTVLFVNHEGLDSVLEGFTVCHGLGDPGFTNAEVARAGGIQCQGSSPTIRDCIVRASVGGPAFDGAFAGAGGIGCVGNGPGNVGPHILNCTIEDNEGGEASPMFMPRRGQAGAGGIHAVESTPFIRACIIRFNVGGDGYFATLTGGAGAVEYTLPPFTPMIEDCEILDNTGGNAVIGTAYAGAGGVHGASPDIHFCRFVGNRGGLALGAGSTGGSGAIFGDAPTIRNCNLLANTGGDATGADAVSGGAGGAMLLGDALMVSTQVAQNAGGSDLVPPGFGGAGGVHLMGGLVDLVNVTVADNTGAEGYDGSGSGGLHMAAGHVECGNAIMWNNTGGAPKAIPSDDEVGGPGTASLRYVDVRGGFPGIGNLDLDPDFVDPIAGDYHLLPTSPCLNVGDPLMPFLAELDLDAEPRVIGPAVELGADEFNFGVFPGSAEDLRLETLINRRGKSAASVKVITAGDRLDATMRSPLQTFGPGLYVLLGQVFTTGMPPVSPPGFPELHVNTGGGFVLAPGPLALADFPVVHGRTWVFNVPVSVAGASLMVQGIALSPAAANGFFAATGGHEMRMQ